MGKVKTCIFISGNGSNLKNLILKSRDYNFPIRIKLVITNNRDAYGLYHAKKNAIPFVCIDTKTRYFENQIFYHLKKHNISLICLAGYMKIVSKEFLKKFGKKVINIHPSLLPKFKGLNTYKRILKNNEKKTGCTVHFVNEKLDAGKIVAQKSFYISKSDNVNTLKDKTQKLEYKIFPEAIIKIYRNI